MLFPRFQSIQDVSAKLTCEVARFMIESEGVGELPEELAGQTSPDWESYVASQMYKAVPLSRL